MFRSPERWLLKEEIELYNNVIKLGEHYARLSAKLRIAPTPYLLWEVEAFGEAVAEMLRWPGLGKVLPFSLIGETIQIVIPRITSMSISGNKASGVAPQAYCYGNEDDEFSIFHFYLPNVLLHEICLEAWGQEQRDRQTNARYTEAPLNDQWQVSLETPEAAYKWLKEDNRGVLLTTFGRLALCVTDAKALTIPMWKCKEILSQLSTLLSFANGGELGPLCIVGINPETDEITANIPVFATVPRENLQPTWFTIESSLVALIRCYQVFERMQQSKHWMDDDRLGIILANYFQALQTPYWPIQASALGMILEYLVAIISAELNKPKDGNRAIQKLLNHIGIIIGDYEQEAFWYIRDKANHFRKKWGPSDKKLRAYPDPYPREINKTLWQATQWVEEILLWRLGYDGKYRNRYNTRGYASTRPRYNLSTRLPGW